VRSRLLHLSRTRTTPICTGTHTTLRPVSQTRLCRPDPSLLTRRWPRTVRDRPSASDGVPRMRPTTRACTRGTRADALSCTLPPPPPTSAHPALRAPPPTTLARERHAPRRLILVGASIRPLPRGRPHRRAPRALPHNMTRLRTPAVSTRASSHGGRLALIDHRDDALGPVQSLWLVFCLICHHDARDELCPRVCERCLIRRRHTF